MSRLHDLRFLALAVTAVQYARDLDRCEPDVGMPPSTDVLIDDVEKRANIMFTNHEREIIRVQLEKY